MVSASTWAVRVALSKTNSSSFVQVREPQKRKPCERISVVMPAAFSRPASVSALCKSQCTSLVMPSTPFSGTFDRLLCQPCSLSMRARRPMAKPTGETFSTTPVPVLATFQPGHSSISSRASKFSR